MRIDVYLQIDGIKGESIDAAHEGWIEVGSAQWSVTQSENSAVQRGGGHVVERREHHHLSIAKLADLSSPMLMQTCAAGRTIPRARLEFMRADGHGERVKYYEIELENVLIFNIDQVLHEGGVLHDAIGLKFSKIKWKYTQHKIGGAKSCGGWDLAANKII